jgi:hypothetical protein
MQMKTLTFFGVAAAAGLVSGLPCDLFSVLHPATSNPQYSIQHEYLQACGITCLLVSHSRRRLFCGSQRRLQEVLDLWITQ